MGYNKKIWRKFSLNIKTLSWFLLNVEKILSYPILFQMQIISLNIRLNTILSFFLFFLLGLPTNLAYKINEKIVADFSLLLNVKLFLDDWIL